MRAHRPRNVTLIGLDDLTRPESSCPNDEAASFRQKQGWADTPLLVSGARREHPRRGRRSRSRRRGVCLAKPNLRMIVAPRRLCSEPLAKFLETRKFRRSATRRLFAAQWRRPAGRPSQRARRRNPVPPNAVAGSVELTPCSMSSSIIGAGSVGIGLSVCRSIVEATATACATHGRRGNPGSETSCRRNLS